jgi:hypothetical protein
MVDEMFSRRQPHQVGGNLLLYWIPTHLRCHAVIKAITATRGGDGHDAVMITLLPRHYKFIGPTLCRGECRDGRR